MRVIVYKDGVLELRWTWLPYWLGVSPTVKQDVETMIRDAVLLNGITATEEALDRIDKFVITVLCRRFPIQGMQQYLEALHGVSEPC